MLVGIPEDLDVYGRNIDVEIIEIEWECVFVFMWLGHEQFAGCCERGNELSGSILNRRIY